MRRPAPQGGSATTIAPVVALTRQAFLANCLQISASPPVPSPAHRLPGPSPNCSVISPGAADNALFCRNLQVAPPCSGRLRPLGQVCWQEVAELVSAGRAGPPPPQVKNSQAAPAFLQVRKKVMGWLGWITRQPGQAKGGQQEESFCCKWTRRACSPYPQFLLRLRMVCGET